MRPGRVLIVRLLHFTALAVKSTGRGISAASGAIAIALLHALQALQSPAQTQISLETTYGRALWHIYMIDSDRWLAFHPMQRCATQHILVARVPIWPVPLQVRQGLLRSVTR